MSALSVLLFLWTLVLTGNCLQPEQIKRVTDHIKNTITKDIIYPNRGTNQQYAYVVKFSEDQCRELNENDIQAALKQDVDTANQIVQDVLASKIYIGSNLAIASYKDIIIDVKKRKTTRRHAERRLLSSEDSGPVPVEFLLSTGAGCVIFYTLYSPCTRACTNLDVTYNIIKDFNLFKDVNDKAFVFGTVYPSEKDESAIWKSFKTLNDNMPLFRCSNTNCMKCFEKQNNKLTQNQNCFAYN